jgi:hypothetical protein
MMTSLLLLGIEGKECAKKQSGGEIDEDALVFQEK